MSNIVKYDNDFNLTQHFNKLNQTEQDIFFAITSEFTKKNEKKLESDSISFELNNNQWFNNAIEAQEFAKNNPMISITRSPCGNGYIVKK